MQFLNAVQKRYSSFQEFVTYAADGAMHTHTQKKNPSTLSRQKLLLHLRKCFYLGS